MTQGTALGLLAAIVAVVVLADTPCRDLELAASCHGLAGFVRALAVHPDGRAVWACTSNGKLATWDPASGGPVSFSDGASVLRRGPRSVALAVHRDGGRLASTDGTGVETFDMTTGERAGPRLEFPGAVRLALTPDGGALAVGASDGTVRLGDPSRACWSRSFRAHTSAIWSLAFSDDGRLVASSSRNSHTARVWEVATGRLLAEVDGRTGWQSVALSPAGEMLATAGRDGVVRVWEVSTGRLLGVVDGHQRTVTCLAFSPDGASLACGGVGFIELCHVPPSLD